MSKSSTDAADGPPSVTCTLCVAGKSFDPGEFTELVGIAPTKVWHLRADLRDRPELHNLEWRYEFQQPDCDLLNEPIREVMRPFLVHSDAIRSFVRRNQCLVHLRAFVRGQHDAIVLEIASETVRQLASLDCEFSIGFDLNQIDVDGPE